MGKSIVASLLCAWVIWGWLGDDEWMPFKAFDDRQSCEKAVSDLVLRTTAEGKPTPTITCLPDTVDPRKRR